MRTIFFILLYFVNVQFTYANNNIVYLDIQYIVDNSDLGIYLKKKISNTQEKIKLELTIKEKIIKEKETDIKNKKNILKKEEIDKSLNELNSLIKNYQIFRKDSAKTILEEKNKYRNQILELLSPILSDFATNNNINLILKKKDILVGAKVLDITSNVMLILNEETKKKNLIYEN